MNSKGIYYQKANISFQKNVDMSDQITVFDEQSVKIPFALHNYFMTSFLIFYCYISMQTEFM